MRKIIIITVLLLILGGITVFSLLKTHAEKKATNGVSDFVFTEPEFEIIDPSGIFQSKPSWFFRNFRTPDLSNWKRPDGPTRVGIQVGHWKSNELPDELQRLRERGGGTSGGGKAEWQVNLAITEALQKILESKGIVVDIIPATVSPSYFADVFLSIHADGNKNSAVSGFKIAFPRRDITGKADELVSILEEEYQKVTGMKQDSNITRNMSGYYAFNWGRYEHTIHPMTVAAIIETGFLTSVEDQKILIRNPEKAAQGIANGILKFLNL